MVALLAGVCPAGRAASAGDAPGVRWALKTNLLHDVVITPDVGAELWLESGRVSVALESVWAWWSHDARHCYWRVRGGWLEARRWIGPNTAPMEGHHVGIYGSFHDFDFEFGAQGVRSPHGVWGAGVSYGYSLPVCPRLNLDFNLRVGYACGDILKYKPQCGTYVCTGRNDWSWIGPTAVEVTLVWFPGRGRSSRP